MASLLDGSARSRGVGKSASAYRTISEVSDELSVPQHVLRFWESKFSQVRPLKRGGGRRYYRPEDIALLRQIQKLLYEDGYTIRGRRPPAFFEVFEHVAVWGSKYSDLLILGFNDSNFAGFGVLLPGSRDVGGGRP